MMIWKATAKDIDAVEKLYDAIHTAEENGKQTIGWIRGIYPVRKTAEVALSGAICLCWKMPAKSAEQAFLTRFR